MSARGRVAQADGVVVVCPFSLSLQERRLLFDIYIGTLFLRSKSGYDAVREWVEPLVERGAE
ncbi:hypothetical protein GY45DRAFT_1324768 [Cubamyces sp. BRFM 1775]|nr:hypothetical protein GY45DRAFT_1324768 [Cubamyces sp. BRFM 1775]